MPKYANNKQYVREQPDVYEIRKNNYSPQFEVTARTVDHFYGVGEDADTKSLVETLKTFQQGVGTYSTLQDIQKKDNSLKAVTDANNNVYDKPSGFFNLGVGYDEAHGETKMMTARINAESILKANNFFYGDKQKIQQTIDEQYKNSGIDFSNQAQMNGASHQYAALKNFALAGGTAAEFERKKVQHLQDIGTTTDNLIFKATSEGITDPAALRNLVGTVRHTMDSTLVKPEEQAKVAVRSILDAGQRRVNTYLKEGDVAKAEEHLQTVLEILRTPDKDGVNWTKQMDENGNFLGLHVNEFEDKMISHIERAERKQEIENDKVIKDNTNYYASQLIRAKNRDEVLAIYKALPTLGEDGENELDNAAIAHLSSVAASIIDKAAYIHEDPVKVFNFKTNVFQGKVSISQVSKALADGNIDVQTASWALGHLEQLKARQEMMARENRQQEFLSWEKSYTQGHSYLLQRYGKDDIERYGMVEDYYNTLVNSGTHPTAARADVIAKFESNTSKTLPFATNFNTAQDAVAAYDAARKMSDAPKTYVEGLRRQALLWAAYERNKSMPITTPNTNKKK